jgi:hypothetical protein
MQDIVSTSPSKKHGIIPLNDLTNNLPKSSCVSLSTANCRSRLMKLGLPTEPVFLNVYGAQESILRNVFRQPM